MPYVYPYYERATKVRMGLWKYRDRLVRVHHFHKSNGVQYKLWKIDGTESHWQFFVQLADARRFIDQEAQEASREAV